MNKKSNKFYTPDGVRDILFEECRAKKDIEFGIRSLLRGEGYNEIETPSIEYYDTFATGKTPIDQEMMYSFTDNAGRLLVMRPDLTVPAARFYATKLKNAPKPVKLFYIGNVFRRLSVGGGRYAEVTQAGIEIIGDGSAKADAEAVIQAIGMTRAAGLEDFQIDMGHMDYFHGLMEEGGFDPEEREEIRLMVVSKNYGELEYYLDRKEMDPFLKDLILKIPMMFGGIDILNKAEKLTGNPKALKAIGNLKEILGIVKEKGLDKYVSFDLGLVTSREYYTGAVFKGYAHGTGFSILSGGRYDGLVENFGDPESATGFCMDINLVMNATGI